MYKNIVKIAIGCQNMTEEKQRIAKYLARASVASRRQVEQMIMEGRIKLNGKVLETPAVKVDENDVILLDNQPVGKKQETKIYRYYKPKGLVTTHRDEKNRPTVFDQLPKELGHLISIGRLDLNSEGLLLLTNDGELARHLELPSTGWIRKYKVRSYGKLKPKDIEALKKGIKIDGIQYGSCEVKILTEGQNFWSEVSLKEGKNREIRKLFEHFDCQVSRLIRLSFGAFHLAKMKEGELMEVPQKMLKEQLGNWRNK